MVRVLAAILALVAVSGSAEASQEFLFRYKSTLIGWQGPSNPDAPTDCPEAASPYSATSVIRVSDGCLYTNPKVEIPSAAALLPPAVSTLSAPLPEGTAPSVDPWCNGVWKQSSARSNGESDQTAAVAGYLKRWDQLADPLGYATFVVCGDGQPYTPPEKPLPPEPHTPIDSLLNADFNQLCGMGTCHWSGGPNGWSSSAGPISSDKQLGGTNSMSPYYGDRAWQYYQDVDVPPELTAKSFTIEWDWLQSASAAGKYGRIGIEFRNGATVLGSKFPASITVDKPWSWYEHSAKAMAPVGTKTVRVVLDFIDGGARYDNVALKIDGVDYSTINGSLGKPERPLDALLNAGAEAENAHWRVIPNTGNPQYGYALPSSTIDPFNFVGRSWHNRANEWSPARYQQVWIGESDKERPITLRWFQSSSGSTNTEGLVFVEFYTKDGTKLAQLKQGAQPRVPMFWTKQMMAGSVPAGAAYALVNIKFFYPATQWLDSITLNVDGQEYGAFHGEVGHAFDYCPHYINTVNGDGDWSGDMDTGSGPLVDDPLNKGVKPETYKNYCVPAGGGTLLGEYVISGTRAYGGFEYTAYDINGNVLAQKKTVTGTGSNTEVPSAIAEVFRFPADTAYIQKRFVRVPNTMTSDFWIAHYAGVSQYVIKASDINFTLHGELPMIDAAKLKTKLYNGSADSGTQYWFPLPGTKGFLTVHSQSLAVAADSGRVMPPRSTATTSTAYCLEPCGPIHVNNAFKAVTGQLDAYQDVHLQPYRFRGGETVRLNWSQSATGSGFTYWLDAFNSSANGASMSVEAHDVNGNVLRTVRAPDAWSLFFLQKRSLEMQLPAGTWSLRVIMHYPSTERALIDEIKLSVGDQNLTADDQVDIPWEDLPEPEAKTLVVGAGAEGQLHHWQGPAGYGLSAKSATPAPYSTGGTAYLYAASAPATQIDFHQDIQLQNGHRTGDPVSVSWLQANNVDTGVVNVRFFDAAGNDVGGTVEPLAAMTPANAWRHRVAALDLPAGALRMRTTVSILNVNGGSAATYIDNIRIQIGDRDYTDYTGPGYADRILGADAEGNQSAWTTLTGGKALATISSSPGPYIVGGGTSFYYVSGVAAASWEQFADISGGGHSAGDDVVLTWHQSSWEGMDKGAVNLEFYDAFGTLLGGTYMPVQTVVPAQTWQTRETSMRLPSNAATVRAVISMERVNGTGLDAYIDNIRIRIGGRDYTDYTGPSHATRILGSGAEDHIGWWQRGSGTALLTRTTDPVPAPDGGTAYFNARAATGRWHQDVDIRGGSHAAGAPVTLSFIQSSWEAKDMAAVNLEFYDVSGAKIGQTNLPVITVPAKAWAPRSETVALPAGTAVMRAVMSMQRTSGTNLDGYVDNIRVQIDGTDYTDFTGAP